MPLGTIYTSEITSNPLKLPVIASPIIFLLHNLFWLSWLEVLVWQRKNKKIKYSESQSIQKYLEKPLLYNNRKFDIRMWAFINHKGDLFYYKHGYLRTSSDNYSLDNLKENYIHLTNNCLQKHGDKYGAHEEGNTISFDVFKHYLKEKFPNIPLDFDKHIIPRIKDMIIDCYLAGKSEINPRKRKNCFELLGFDFMIDEDFKVWLIEVTFNKALNLIDI